MKGSLKRCFSLMTLATAISQYMAILHHGWLKSSALWARPSLTLDNFPINYDQKHKHCPKGNWCEGLIIILRQAPHILHPSSMIFTYLQFRTPHIDSLFASSLTLPSFYTSSPVCIRIALFCGLKIRDKNKRCAHPLVPPSLLDYLLSPGGTIYTYS